MHTQNCLRIVLLCLSLISSAVQAQGTTADYARTEMLKPKLDGFVVGKMGAPAADSGAVKVPGASLTYVVEGRGRPCMVVGMQVYYRRTFSPRFKQNLRCAYLDLRHFAAGAQERPGEPYGLATAVEDIEAARRTLGLDHFILVGHSIHGLMALAYARRYPQHVSGMIAIAAPPAYTPEVVRRAQQFWETQSSPGRRAALQRSWASIPRDSMAKLSYGNAMVTGYVLTAARYWADSTYDGAWLWKGVTVNGPLAKQIFTPSSRDTLPSGGAPSQVPVFVALGRYDYVVPTVLWDGAPVPFRNLTVRIFEHSGHTPQLEQPGVFDAQVLVWLRSVHF